MSEYKRTSLRNFVKEWKSLIKKVKGDDWAVYPDPGIYTLNPEDITTPTITYKTGGRKPYEKSARKPSFKNETQSMNQSDEVITEYGQQFVSFLKLGIYGKSYDKVDITRELLEEFMIDYTGYFREKGILELVFEQQFEDDAVDIKGEVFVKQEIEYYVRHERTRKMANTKLKEIQDDIELPDDYKAISEIIANKTNK
jgi:hypothetical protein